MRRTCAVVIAVMLSLVAACSAGGTAPGPSQAPTRSAAAANPVPAEPESVSEALPAIERFVEHERGLRFKRPVLAKVLGRKAFIAKLDQGESKPKPKAVERVTSFLASLGLISPYAAVAKAFRTAEDEGTLGFYDDKTKRLYVRGTRATPGVRAVLAHELTHALTDQWFGLHRPKLDKNHQELELGFTALTEGDAERTRKAYEAQVLTPAERRIAEREENGGGRPPHVPQIVLELIGFPYAIGPQFVHAVIAQGGISALNAAYRRPPTSSEQLIDPTRYFAHDNPKPVPQPAAGGARLDHGDVGEVGLLLMFEHGLTRSQAQFGVTGWGGDHYVTWRAGDHRWCLRDSVVMDYGLATNAFDSTLTAWVRTRNGKAHIDRRGSTTTFTTCSS